MKALVGEWSRFFTVNVAGLIVDLTGAMILRALGLNLFLAASVSFTVAAFLNFQLHSRWTFRGAEASALRLAGYFTSALVTIGARLLFLKILLLLNLPVLVSRDLELLVLATGGSLLVNYTLCKYLIFRD